MAKRPASRKNSVRICVVGDVSVNRDDPESVFALVAPTIRRADIAFCQLETLFSENGSSQVRMLGGGERAHPRNVSALVYAGFDVVSCAGNHCMDWGLDGFFDTLDVLRQNNIAFVGAGKDLAEARKPVIIKCRSTRVAFLAYNSIVPPGYAASADWPGCAAIKVSTLYEPIEYQPGTPCRTLTFADRDDLRAMKDDIEKVRPLADVVIVSLHGGLHFVPAVIPMYQRELSHAAIDAGADSVLSHHAHILKGIDVYRGRVIFYGLGNFAFDMSLERLDKSRPLQAALQRYKVRTDPDYPTYPFPIDAKKTMMVRLIIRNGKIERVSFLPAFINRNGQPEFLRREDENFGAVLTYMEDICRDQGLDTRFSVEGDEVVVLA